MKKLYFLIFTILIAASGFGQTTFFTYSFEDNGNGTVYTTSTTEFSDIGVSSGYDFFTSTFNNTIGGAYGVTGQDGSYYFAAQDIDGEGASAIQTLTMSIDITGKSSLGIKLLLAEDDFGDPSWDDADYFHIDYSIDGGSVQNFLWIESDGTTSFNAETKVDTNFDGVGDGITIPETFIEFEGALIGSGSTLTLTFTFNLNSGSEDIALDYIRIIDGYVPSPTIAIVNGPASGSTVDLGPEDLSGELEFVVTNFNVDTQGNGGDGYIVWTVLNTTTVTPHDSGGPLYDLTPDPFIPLEPDYSYYFVAQLISYATSNVVAEYDLNINTLGYNSVADLAALRAGTEGLYYEVTGEVIVSFVTGSSRNQIYIQDDSAAILIDDPDGIITTTYLENEGITGLKGQLSSFGNLLQIVPTTDPGAATSSGNPITSTVVTINDLITNMDNYESEAITIYDVTFTDPSDGTFLYPKSYDITDQSGGPIKFRTQYPNAQMTGVNIPVTTATINGIAGEYFTEIQVYPYASNSVLSIKNNQIDGFAMYPNPTSLGYLNITSKSQTAMKVGVYDVLGKQVINETVDNNRLDVSILTTGIYIMKISQDNASKTKKLIIK